MNRKKILNERKFKSIAATMLLVGFLASSAFSSDLSAQTSSQASKQPVAAAHARYQPDRFAGRAGRYYQLIWGVDSLSVKAAESGELIRFTYRVLDPIKAKDLNDKKIEAFLISPEASVKLVIPSLEKVGQLRQSNTPETGRSYWMAFSNPRRIVKRGDRVNVEIGQFHAVGLVVE